MGGTAAKFEPVRLWAPLVAWWGWMIYTLGAWPWFLAKNEIPYGTKSPAGAGDEILPAAGRNPPPVSADGGEQFSLRHYDYTALGALKLRRHSLPSNLRPRSG